MCVCVGGGGYIPVLWNNCLIQWNPDFSNLLRERKLVRKIGSSKNRRWHEITLDLRGIVL